MDILAIINQIIEGIKGLYSAKKAKDDLLFNEYIEKVYLNTQLIYDDFRKVLYTAHSMVRDYAQLGEVIEYLNKSRLQFKSTRDKIRATLCVEYFKDEELADFYVNVCGVLQGGMNESVENRIKLGFGPAENLNTDKRWPEHTLVDLIDKINEIYQSRCGTIYINDKPREIYPHTGGLESALISISFQIDSTDKYWNKLSQEYAKLKYKKLK